MRHDLILSGALLSIGILSRLIPHAPNATAMTAITVAGVLYLKRPYILTLPLLTLFLSDLIIGFYDWRMMAVVYSSFGAIALGSAYAPRIKYGWALTLIGSPLFFFLTTNFMVWLTASWYEKTLAGLLLSYELGLPFLRSMMLGDVLYTVGVIGVIEVVRSVLAASVRRTLPVSIFRDIIDTCRTSPCASINTWHTRSTARAVKQIHS